MAEAEETMGDEASTIDPFAIEDSVEAIFNDRERFRSEISY